MTSLEDLPVPRRRKSRRKRRSRKTRRFSKAIGWSLLALVTTGIFIVGTIYLVLSMRGEGTTQKVDPPPWTQ